LTEEQLNLTRTETEYLKMICSLAARAAAGTDFGKRSDAGGSGAGTLLPYMGKGKHESITEFRRGKINNYVIEIT
jgi:hypothetical protein